MKPRIIYIYNRTMNAWFTEPETDEWYLAGHTGFIAKHLRKYTNKFEIENWRGDATVAHCMDRVVDGITCRVFPSKLIPYFGDISFELLRQLHHTISTSDDIIIHMGASHSFLYLYLLATYGSRIRIICTLQGERIGPLRSRKRAIPRRIIEGCLIKKAYHYFCTGNTSLHILLSLGVPNSNISFPEIGVNLESFRPMDQKQAREQLNLPMNKSLMLYIGRADEAKGLTELLNVLPEVRSRCDADLVCVGFSEQDPLFSRVNEMNIRYWKHVPHEMLPLFHNACDVLVRPGNVSREPISVGVNVIESLACGSPVVAPSLAELPYYATYAGAIGIAPQGNLADAIMQILKEGKAGRSEVCRAAAQPYSWDQWLHKLVSVYES